MSKVTHRTLYKRDTAGKVRVWWVETDDDQYRVVSGIKDGKLVESDWRTAVAKNVGRANATTGAEQALSETKSLYDRQLNQGKYHESESDIDSDGYFEPMLATRWSDSNGKSPGKDAVVKALSVGTRVFVQPKFDGIRNVADVEGMWSRDGQPRVSCPHIHEHLRPLLEITNGLSIDGELYNHELHDDFNSIQSLILQRKPGPEELAATREKAHYYVYDCFFPGDPDLDFSDRFDHLEGLLTDMGLLRLPVVLVETHEVTSLEEIDEWYGKFLELGYEGMVVRIDYPYENKRSKSLVKRKEFFDEEFEVVDIIEGQGNWEGKAKAVKFKSHPGDDRSYDDLPKAGIKGNEAELAELLRNKGDYMNNGSEVTVRFPNKTPGGDPRFGVAIKFWPGGRRE